MSMLQHASLPLRFWAEAVNTAVYLRNRSPTVALHSMTPFERFHGDKPDVSSLKVFCGNAYVHVPGTKRSKLEKKSVRSYSLDIQLFPKDISCMTLKEGNCL